MVEERHLKKRDAQNAGLEKLIVVTVMARVNVLIVMVKVTINVMHMIAKEEL